MVELWLHAFMHFVSHPLIPLRVNFACIKLSSPKTKCKCFNTASRMTHPIPPLFFLTSSLLALCTLFRQSSLHSSTDKAHISDGTEGGAKEIASESEPIYFPSSHRLRLRAHQRDPIEPLKPLLPNMKESNQNRVIGRKPRGEAFDLLVLGHHSEGFTSPKEY